MDKELEELDKTTEVLKSFKSRVADEEQTQYLGDLNEMLKKQERVVPVYDEDKPVVPVYEDLDSLESVPYPHISQNNKNIDDKTLELSDVEIDKTLKLDETETLEYLNEKNNQTDEIDKKLQRGLNKRKKQKRLGLRLIFSLLIFIPAIISAIIVGMNSDTLINSTVLIVLECLLAIIAICIVIGIDLYSRNRKVQLTKKVKAIFKYIYLFGMVIYTTSCATVLILLYGVTDFKDWLVTTAMATKDHKYYCQWFYNQKTIDEVFSRNYIKETGESTNEDLINVNANINPTIYANEYEEAVLKHNPDQTYKMIKFLVNGCQAYLAVIYDPSKVGVTTTNRVGRSGQFVTDMAKREKATVAINGAGFYDPGHSSAGGCPVGITIVDGKIVTNNEYGHHSSGGLVGLTKDNKLVLLKNTTAQEALNMGIRDAVSWGPFLIVNGKAAYTRGNGGWGYAARTAIGQRADGIILMLVVDSNYNRTKGANMVDLTEIMQQYGAINAVNLDGGTSSVMVENGKLISNPIDGALRKQTRQIATAFIATN